MVGSYHQFGAFMSGVASLPRVVIMTMHDISLKPKGGGEGANGDVPGVRFDVGEDRPGAEDPAGLLRLTRPDPRRLLVTRARNARFSASEVHRHDVVAQGRIAQDQAAAGRLGVIGMGPHDHDPEAPGAVAWAKKASEG